MRSTVWHLTHLRTNSAALLHTIRFSPRHRRLLLTTTATAISILPRRKYSDPQNQTAMVKPFLPLSNVSLWGKSTLKTASTHKMCSTDSKKRERERCSTVMKLLTCFQIPTTEFGEASLSKSRLILSLSCLLHSFQQAKLKSRLTTAMLSMLPTSNKYAHLVKKTTSLLLPLNDRKASTCLLLRL